VQRYPTPNVTIASPRFRKQPRAQTENANWLAKIGVT
jgi:hypothetical protein